MKGILAVFVIAAVLFGRFGSYAQKVGASPSKRLRAMEGYPTQPNIIFILTNDQRWSALGYAGNPLVHTPEMDKLARTGTYFKKGMVTTPICAASRSSILSGLYERTHLVSN